MRLILLDNYSRWIVGDTAVFAAGLEEWRRAITIHDTELQRLSLLAARLLDEHIGEFGWSYRFSKEATPEFPIGYLVYRVERGRFVPVMGDEQDPHAYEAVLRNSAYIGFVRWEAQLWRS